MCLRKMFALSVREMGLKGTSDKSTSDKSHGVARILIALQCRGRSRTVFVCTRSTRQHRSHRRHLAVPSGHLTIRETAAMQGVASGDPFTKSVILWTRVTPPSGAKNKPATLDYAGEVYCSTG